jgi:tetratricopeptide (TPR) repeat protein
MAPRAFERARGVPFGPVAWLAVALCFAPAPGVAQALRSGPSLEELERETRALAERTTRLHETTIQPLRMTSTYSLESRLADGRLLYLLGDYGRASIVFLDIVENAPRDSLSFFEARFFLAESLFETRNLVAAGGYYEEIAADPRDRRRPDGVRRLLEIAFETRNFTGLDRLYELLQATAGADVRPDVLYVRAKTLYFSGEPAAALRDFERIPRDSELYPQARYFIGTAWVRLEGWEPALAAFEEARTAALESRDERAAEVADLAALALGRVHYELDRPSAALAAYHAVSRSSRHYDRALYEMCWAFMRAGRDHEALRTLEILMLAVPDSRFLPRAQLMRGDLLLRLAQYEDAQQIYETTVAQFGPLERQLAHVIGREESPDAYFSALIDATSASLMLPNLAREWVEDDTSMRRALALIGDLEGQAREIRESREIIEDIEAVLSSSSRLDLFPELRTGYGHAIEAQNLVFALRSGLVELEAERVRPGMDGPARGAAERLREERLALAEELARLPSTLEDMSRAERQVESRISALETDVYRQSYELQTQHAQVTAMRLMLREEVARGERSLAEADLLETELERFARDLDALERSRNTLRRQLEDERLSTGLASVTVLGQPHLLRQYAVALQREEELLASYRDGVTERDVLRRIDAARLGLGAIDSEIQRFFAEVDRLVAQQTGDITRQLDVETALLDEYDRRLRVFGQQGERLAGEVAFANFIHVQDQFHELILRADVGIIDIAWREKEDRTDRIDQLFQERNRELQVLDAEFREVLQAQ